MSKEKQIDIITELLIDFDEMGFAPTTTVPDPEAYAIKWRAEITKALGNYRKQSEGEWVEQFDEYGENYIFTGFQCSKCEKEFFIPYEQERDDWLEMMKFCPECGAKMKGGAE